jgi:hypothetical protein
MFIPISKYALTPYTGVSSTCTKPGFTDSLGYSSIVSLTLNSYNLFLIYLKIFTLLTSYRQLLYITLEKNVDIHKLNLVEIN